MGEYTKKGKMEIRRDKAERERDRWGGQQIGKSVSAHTSYMGTHVCSPTRKRAEMLSARTYPYH